MNKFEILFLKGTQLVDEWKFRLLPLLLLPATTFLSQKLEAASWLRLMAAAPLSWKKSLNYPMLCQRKITFRAKNFCRVLLLFLPSLLPLSCVVVWCKIRNTATITNILRVIFLSFPLKGLYSLFGTLSPYYELKTTFNITRHVRNFLISLHAYIIIPNYI